MMTTVEGDAVNVYLQRQCVTSAADGAMRRVRGWTVASNAIRIYILIKCGSVPSLLVHLLFSAKNLGPIIVGEDGINLQSISLFQPDPDMQCV
jgi:hypothetical protein